MKLWLDDAVAASASAIADVFHHKKRVKTEISFWNYSVLNESTLGANKFNKKSKSTAVFLFKIVQHLGNYRVTWGNKEK